MPVDKVEKAAADASVLALDLDEVIKLPEASMPSAESAVAATGPGASTPNNNPYMPTNETGAVAFKSANPTWDGRGVTIGILDSGVDVAHPALQQTTTGQTKIADWFTATDPVTEGSLVGGDATWLPMVQDASGPTFGPYRRCDLDAAGRRVQDPHVRRGGHRRGGLRGLRRRQPRRRQDRPDRGSLRHGHQQRLGRLGQ